MMPAPSPSRIESEVARMRALLERRQFAAAVATGVDLAAEAPESRDVLYMLALSQRLAGRTADALETLARLEALHPDFSRLHQERGHCHLAARNPGDALASFLRAVALNASLPASWKALAVLFRSAGKTVEADNAAQHVAKLGSLPPPVVAASGLIADGEIHLAERLLRPFLQEHPDHIEAMRLLAQIGAKLEVLDDAEFLLESVLVFAPDYHLARYDYACVLQQRHKNLRALEEAEKLLAIDPKNPNYRTIHAAAEVALGRYDEAIRAYRELAAELPQSAELHLSIGHAQKTIGRGQEAIDSYRTAARVRPSFGDAYWSLANLKTYRFTDEEIAGMLRAVAAPATSSIDRYHLCFALGKGYEDRGEYAASFAHYERGNALKKREIRYRPESIESTARLQLSVCTRDFFAAREGVGCGRPDPIFIVGLPRAGSTLIEQILASHSRVEGTMELADIPRLVHRLQGRQSGDSKLTYPAVLERIEPAQFRAFGEQFIADTQVYRTGKPFFIDKMPNNFRHLGLIHLMLPNAKIIDARREAMACCFSNFKQLFAAGQEFTYSLEDIARYYRTYIELMDHWNAVLPGRILRLQHEELVDDFEGQVRRLLDFLGLDFEPACLEFYKTDRSVRTASSEQVRRPIYQEGREQWRHFEPWLTPLRQALNAAAPLLR
jgi:tetratricopeptide (TPR) repeat protein